MLGKTLKCPIWPALASYKEPADLSQSKKEKYFEQIIIGTIFRTVLALFDEYKANRPSFDILLNSYLAARLRGIKKNVLFIPEPPGDFFCFNPLDLGAEREF